MRRYTVILSSNFIAKSAMVGFSRIILVDTKTQEMEGFPLPLPLPKGKRGWRHRTDVNKVPVRQISIVGRLLQRNVENLRQPLAFESLFGDVHTLIVSSLPQTWQINSRHREVRDWLLGGTVPRRGEQIYGENRRRCDRSNLNG